MPEFGYNIALVGASSLKGKEVKEALESRSFPVRDLALLDDDEALGQLTEFQGEPTFIRTVTRESFEGADFAIFAATPAFTRANWKLAADQGCHIIDMSYALEDEPPAELRAPLFSLQPATGSPPRAGFARGGAEASSLKSPSVSPHPAALVVSAVLGHVAAQFSIARAVVNVFEPASEHGSAGVEELHRQTVHLLSFQKLPQAIFDRQLAFDLLATGGAHMRPTLEEVERRVDRQVQALLGGRAPRPSLRVAQAATFLGHSFSFHVELEQAASPDQVRRALQGEGIEIRSADQDSPSAVGAAGSGEIVLGDLRPDRANDRAFWLWAAADNLRLAALNAVRIVEEAVKTPQSHGDTEEK